MFKNAEKISKCIDTLMKVTEELETHERQAELTRAIHELSYVYQNVIGDAAPKSIADGAGDSFTNNEVSKQGNAEEDDEIRMQRINMGAQ